MFEEMVQVCCLVFCREGGPWALSHRRGAATHGNLDSTPQGLQYRLVWRSQSREHWEVLQVGCLEFPVKLLDQRRNDQIGHVNTRM